MTLVLNGMHVQQDAGAAGRCPYCGAVVTILTDTDCPHYLGFATNLGKSDIFGDVGLLPHVSEDLEDVSWNLETVCQFLSPYPWLVTAYTAGLTAPPSPMRLIDLIAIDGDQEISAAGSFSSLPEGDYLTTTMLYFAQDLGTVRQRIQSRIQYLDAHFRRLEESYDIWQRQPAELPLVPLSDDEAGLVDWVLRQCDPHAQHVYRSMMTKWNVAGYEVAAGVKSVVLRLPPPARRVALVNLLPEGVMSLLWNELGEHRELPPEAIAAFQEKVAAITPVQETKAGKRALIRATTAFTQDNADDLINAMVELVCALRIAPEPDLEVTGLKLGKVTTANLQTMLGQCGEHSRAIFLHLLTKWTEAGGKVKSAQPDRANIMFTRKSHLEQVGQYLSPQFVLVTIVAPQSTKPAQLEILDDVALPYVSACGDFRKAVQALPGYRRGSFYAEFNVDSHFGLDAADRLLAAAIALSKAEAAS